jgi:polysaccharide deacetylase family protein (PEP-CTERM system associated)
MTGATICPTNAMTVDVEDWFQVAALAERIDPASWDRFVPRVERNTDRLLEMFAGADVRATFFTLGWIAERHPALIRRIAAAGHEVACHGFSHQLVYRQEESVFREETLRSKALLEDLLGRRVRGYRAASYSITRDSLWALDILLEAGFEYDSSVFPVRHDRYGIPGSERWPHRIKAPGGGELVEFPLTTVRWLGMTLPIAGGGYFRLYPYALTRAGLSAIASDARPIIFYLHPWEIDPDQPRIRASWTSRFRHYTNLGRCEARLAKLLGHFRWSACENVLEGLGLLAGNAPGRATPEVGHGLPDPARAHA